MTHTLVIDTSYGSTVGVVGLEPIVETDSRTHVERLQDNIARAVSEAGLRPDQLDRIVVGVGPAPFTGLRAGIVAAKALAFATGAQLLGQDILGVQERMMRLWRKGDDSLRNCPFLEPAKTSADSPSTRHLTLAVNDARRRQLYFALYGDGTGEGTTTGDNVPLIAMDIDYPAHIAERVMEALGSLGEAPCLVDVVGHGARKYAEAWQALGTNLGAVIDSSALDAGGAGLRIFMDAALSSQDGMEQGRHEVSGDDGDADDPVKAADSDMDEHEFAARAIKPNGPVEPLYLRRPDVSVPNPLKHVLNHDGATKAAEARR
ncbi:tRNA (adenosine(37)-N6)-threonylcarbamoyltransferase complex dimerization subunit type 1 TsaB [Bifidobacterium sp. ESL0763]|uniref:tRNA (adenosine(37)-N6)-threonylcarbamoyltransferase complex dimerization subunit type 1 TsaB n=1 Tax=Bifidobacterium sp. ESL0763 TaxID=2983227 RepID=UPI0023F6832E|nr:tRNA (adenosine(37)-N6)-threonylcarbamoyltransferase complex dimerization subunit type 1 TsaB [Bifidobacterium sp. ESL0763]MDF7663764.1 tRNA (adenosine(37)-N6)-threonylcarbamoyltransferase complex dimerization subunit type 1 TsaB [Bifidobacterium sp. ESL0763]